MHPNGTLPIHLGWRFARMFLDLTGGPFDAYAAFKGEDTYGVCVRSERVPATADLLLPISDFSTPSLPIDAVQSILKIILRNALHGKRIYVGCAGGWGRTGLVLALIAKAAGSDDPVSFVRRTYTPRAIETPAQERYVESFPVEEIRRWLFREAWRAKLHSVFPFL